MEKVLAAFITAARAAGVRISVAETLDAMRAVQVVGYADRAFLKGALAASLAKTAGEKVLLEDCFERFFSFGFFTTDPKLFREDAGPPDRPGTDAPLIRMLLEGDQAGLLTAMTEAARQEDLSQIRHFTQRSLFAMRILNRMGGGGLDSEIQTLRREDAPAAGARAARLEAARSYLSANVRDYVQKYYDLFAPNEGERNLESDLRRVKLSAVEERHYCHMHRIIQRLVKRLNDRRSRRRKAARRGVLDFKRTLRENVSCQGLLFSPFWKQRKIDRPEIVVICDVSHSVIATVRFLLLFLYGLNEEIAKIRTFVFCTNLVEVSDILDRYPVDEAMSRIQQGTDTDLILGRTNYARSLQEFRRDHLTAVTRKTTVLVLGDARNNNNDPCPENLKAIYERCKRLIWLNPETPTFWNTGDSELRKYTPHCTIIQECNTLRHIERLVTSLVRNRGK